MTGTEQNTRSAAEHDDQSKGEMTLYEATGYCPLQLYLDYRLKGDCVSCPFENGVDVGIGWIHHCAGECMGGYWHDENEDLAL
jgi:hypothetical protein